MRDVFDLVPALAEMKESAYGLGATTWEVVWKVVLPYTKVGVIGRRHAGTGGASLRGNDGGSPRDRQCAPALCIADGAG